MLISTADLAESLSQLLPGFKEKLPAYRRIQALDEGGDVLLHHIKQGLGSSADDANFQFSESAGGDISDERVFYISFRDKASPPVSSRNLNRNRESRLFFIAERAPHAHGAAQMLLEMASQGWVPLSTERCNSVDPSILASILAPRDCRIRPGSQTDMASLLELEQACWAPGLQSTERDLTDRFQRFSDGQYVLETDGQVVAAIYAQRIASASFAGLTAVDAHSLHDSKGRIMQLLALNVLPSVQDRGFGDLLLEFALQRASATPDFEEVVGITRCKDYGKRSDLSLIDYVNLRNEQGHCVDPVLRLHELHGARIIGLVPGYRPADAANNGAGVLVRYDLRNREHNHRTVQDLASQERPSDTTAFVRTAIADILALPESIVSTSAPLFELGLDSANLLDLNERLSAAFSVALEPAFFFEHNTCARIAAYLDLRDEARSHAPAQAGAKTKGQTESCVEDVAIVGMACRLPGGVNSPDGFWRLLLRGEDAVTTLPPERWQWPEGFDLASHPGIDRGGFLDDIAGFDAAFFRISPREATAMDPQQRLLLETAWQCFEDAGWLPSELAGSETGVFVGASGSDYYLRLCEQPLDDVEGHFVLGSSMAVLANRLSYFFDFSGPSLQIDTACSSSLVALHEAVTALRHGACDRALVAGVNILCHPASSVAFYRAGMLSKDGRCKTFDSSADGYVRGEGVVALLIKPLAAALADGDRIQAVIKGTATNHGGLSAGLTVPNPAKQASLVERALESAGVAPETVTYVEAHGTGTSLGDPVEVRGLKQALGAGRSEPTCYLGSAKTNIGHLEAAAGLAGVLKTVLALQTQTIPASLNFNSLNPHLSLQDSRFRIAAPTQPWPRTGTGALLRAGVSSFGSGGTNAHVILEEAPVRIPGPRNFAKGPVAIPLSARTPQALRNRVSDLVAAVEAQDDAPSLEEIAYTLQACREPFDCRLAVTASSKAELISKLRAFIDSDKAELDSDTSADETRVNPLRRWAMGEEIDWNEFWTGPNPSAVALPTYPFDHKRYWLGERSEQRDAQQSPPGTDDIPSKLREYLSEVLDVPPHEIPDRADLRSMGLDSIGSIKLRQHIEKGFGVALSGLSILDIDNFETLAAHVASATTSARQDAEAKLKPMSETAPLQDLSEGQKGLWALQMAMPDMDAYNLIFAFRVGVAVDPERFERALSVTIAEHPVLGEGVIETAHGPQRTSAVAPPRIEREDIRHLDEQETLAHLKTLSSRPFSLAEAAPIRAHLLETESGTTVLFVIHHIAFDAGSIAPFFETLLDIYFDDGSLHRKACSEGGYTRFVTWEQDFLSGPEGASAREHFRHRLEGLPPAIEHPVKSAQEPKPGYDGNVIDLTVSRELSKAVDKMCRAERVTTASLLLTTYLIAVERYLGNNELVVGVTNAGRSRAEFSSAVGYFVNVVPVRLGFDEGKAWADVIRDIQRTLTTDLDHAAYPFAALVRDIEAQRVPGRSPVFQVVFNHQSYFSPDAFRMLERRYAKHAELSFIDELRQSPHNEIELESAISDGRIILRLKHDANRIDCKTAERLIADIHSLIEQAASKPYQSIRTTSILTEQVTTTASPIVSNRAPEECLAVHDRIARQADRTPDAIAFRYGGETLTYSELERRSNSLAHALAARGVGADRIGVCLHRSLDLPVAMLGVMKAGGAYVPIEPDHPSKRLEHIVSDSAPKLIITETSLIDKVGMICQGEAALLNIKDHLSSPRDSAPPIVRDAASRTAYVIYTSGSTGKPKGVIIGQRAFASALTSLVQTVGLKSLDHLFAVTTFGFDIAGFELFGPLLVGASCTICASDVVADVERLQLALSEARPTIIQAVPSLWTMLFDAGWLPSRNMRLVCGGEALPERLRQRFESSGVEAWNMYGPTEATIWATAQRVAIGEAAGVGKPLSNTRIYIVDEELRPTAAGTVGELCIAGFGLADGYLNQPELTRERFVPNPFEGQGRLYRTGDRARLLEDGSIDVLGRADGQVKLRGYRIELAEIEKGLTTHNFVNDAVVVLEKFGDHGRLAAYFTVTGEVAPDTAALRAHLRDCLPHYMIPTKFQRVDRFPLTANGKIDRLALGNLDGIERQSSSDAAPNRNLSDLETTLAEIWKNTLAIPDVGRHDAFFDVGGDSVLAITVARRIAAATGQTFGVTDLFRYPTIASSAAHLFSKLPAAAPITEDAGVASQEPAEASPPKYAIVGISCCFPDADGLDAFWGRLLAGHDAVRTPEIDELRRRKAPDAIIGDARFVPASATIKGKQYFDAAFFRVTPRDAERMHPQMRLLLMHSWAAVEDAGYAVSRIADTGVFMSTSNTQYATAHLPDDDVDSARVLSDFGIYQQWLLDQPGTVPTIISNRLGLTGPSCFVHSNCSSSLVGLDLACQALARGEANQALVGAASLLSRWSDGYLHQEGLNFAAGGRIKAFSAAADGMVAGEGVAVIMVKRYRDALRDGDHIYAVVRGVAVNNDGSAKAGFYAPSIQGQAAVITRALALSGIEHKAIKFVEAHGTGTLLGDPIEVAALKEAFKSADMPRGSCALGSVKSNIGHSDVVAGLAGLIKAALALEHGVVPPTLHAETINPQLEIEDSPFFISSKPHPLPPGVESCAAISSFGIGGTNAHAILERSPPPEKAIADLSGAEIFIVSGKDLPALERQARSLVAALERLDDADLPDIAFTLQVGREAFEARLAIVASTRVELIDLLEHWLARDATAASVYANVGAVANAGMLNPDPHPEAPAQRWLENRTLEPLANLWARGYPVDWHALARLRPTHRMRLPTYAFEKLPFWTGPSQPLFAERRFTHPLLQENISSSRRRAFMAHLSGDEVYISDHVVNGRCVLPGVIHLEMARAASAKFFEVPDTSIALSDVLWLKPVLVEPDTPLFIDVELETDETLSWSISTAKESKPDSGDRQAFSRGRARVVAGNLEAPTLQTAELLSPGLAAVEGDACYEYFANLGFAYGDSFRTLERLRAGRSASNDVYVLADVALSPSYRDERFVLHPGITDAMLQSRLGFDGSVMGVGPSQPSSMPFSIDDLVIYAPTPDRGVVWARVAGGTSDDASLPALDIDVADETGKICVSIRGLISRPISAEGKDNKTSTSLARPVWRASLRLREHTTSSVPRLVVLCGSSARTRAVRDAIATQMPKVRHMLIDTDRGTIGDCYRTAAVELLLELKSLAADSSEGDILVQVVICGDGDESIFEGLSGLVLTAGQEFPHLIGRTIRHSDATSADDISRALFADAAAPHTQLRYDSLLRRHVLSWEEADRFLQDRPAPWRAGGIYLITGGLGGLGLIFAEDIARRAPETTLILVGRSPPAKETKAAIEHLESLGARVVVRAVDIGDASAVSDLIAGVTEEFGAISGVLHAAGILRDGLMAFKTVEDFEDVLQPKVDGTLNIDAATADQPIELFVLFSSVTGALGNVGQIDYAAANGFLDAFAERRNRLREQNLRKGHTIAIDWPLWADGGMQIDASTVRLQRARGLAPLATSDGLMAFDAAVATGEHRVMVLSGDLAELRRSVLKNGDDARSTKPDNRSKTQNSTPRSGPPSSRTRERAAEIIKGYASKVMKLKPSQIEVGADLDRYGIDSMIAIELVVALEKTFGPLPKTLLFEHRTINDLADYFLATHNEKLIGLISPDGHVSEDRSKDAVQERSQAASSLPRARTSPPFALRKRDDDVAIIGLAGRYPKARHVSDFWENLRAGTDCITEVPANRWNHARYFHPDKSQRDKTYGKWGGFIDGMDECDSLFFSIAPREMETIDPQERLFLQTAYEAIEDAGYTRETLAREPGTSANVAVYVGVMYAEYQLYGAQAQARGGSLTLTGSPASIANRVSYFFNFNGPSVAVDTMCSSSLTAIHLACRDLMEDCDYAIAGGVNISVHPNKYLFLAQHNFMSSEGRCAAFGTGGDGYVPGEGVGAVLLKPLSRALADGDRIYGVIRGTAVNHGGKTNGYTVPNPLAQGRAIEHALRSAGVDARHVSYVEAHGTGTALGDPIEIAGLSRAFAAFTPDRGFCAIGSAKSNIGHCESAAGIAGLTKVLLQMKYGELAPSLHAQSLNPHIDFEASPFVVQRELAPWQRISLPGDNRELPRIAGISSFGAGGSNAHIIVEEYDVPSDILQPGTNAGPQIIVLSARTEDRLRARVQDLLAALAPERVQASTNLADIAYTLQVGRDAMDERLAFTATTLDEARDRLQFWLSGSDDSVDIWSGHRRERDGVLSMLGETDLSDIVARWLAQGQLDRIAEAWTKGVPIHWQSLHTNGQRKRVELPTYPFERNRYWPADAHDRPTAIQSSTAHPLVQANASNFYQQKFESRFDGSEPFFTEHVVKGTPVLPAAAHLEMARFSVATLTANAASIRLSDIAFVRPLRPKPAGVSVTIEVTPQENGNMSWQICDASKEKDDARIYSQGSADLVELSPPPHVDLEELFSRSWRVLPVGDVYGHFADRGLRYGQSFKGLKRLAVLDGRERRDRCVFAELALPTSGLTLEPGILDGAFQATLALDSSIEQAAHGAPDLPVPFAIDEVMAYTACPERAFVLARYAHGSGPDAPTIKIDVDLVADDGTVCVSLRGLAGRSNARSRAATNPKLGSNAVLLAPIWEPARPKLLSPWPTPNDRVYIIGRGPTVDTCQSALPTSVRLNIDGTETVEQLAQRLRALEAIDHLIWCLPPADPSLDLGQRQIEMQETGVLFGFRLVKALLDLGYSNRPFAWTTITEQAIATHNAEEIDPAHASIHGFLGSAAKEFASAWKLRIVDIPRAAPLPLEQILCLPHVPNGDVLAWRGGEWLRRALLPSKLEAPFRTDWPQDGVYVVIGGAGGIGEVWTRHVAQHQRAKVVWLGRRPEDDAIRAKISRIAEVGPAPIYLQAAATDRSALEAAREKILATVGPISGLVHAALVLKDAPLARMDEAQFRESLEAKVDSSINMLSAFASSSLKTITFFSSTMSFATAAGQSNYSAGCTFVDAFAHAVRVSMGVSTKVMNWGWWGSVGVVATEFYRSRMRRLGFASVEPDEGMAALQILLDSPLHQAAFLKATRPLSADQDAVLDETLHVMNSAFPSVIAGLGRMS